MKVNVASLEMERSIARCRVALSLITIVAVYLDPTQPVLTRWLPVTGGPFMIGSYQGIVLLVHLAYSLTLVSLRARTAISPARLVAVATAGDVLFGGAIALVTEGSTSPFHLFFAFAVMAVGLRSGLYPALTVTMVSVAFYTSIIELSATSRQPFYLMRAAYLAIMGYFVGYLGQERLRLEETIHTLEADAQRQRIARSLHDGYAQTLAGVTLRLEGCEELLRRGLHDEALAELSDLQSGVSCEHEAFRTYIRSLVDLEASLGSLKPHVLTRFSVHADFDGPAPLIEEVLQIMLEATRNVRRHAEARFAVIRGQADGSNLILAIDDDGIGFPVGFRLPWSIASRVSEFGGKVAVADSAEPGGHLRIELPVR
jgi:signal transduction histidine kinase